MLRKEKIYQIIDDDSKQFTLEDLKQKDVGITSYQIADQLHIARNNASTDLNELWEEGKIIKITGKKKFAFFSQKIFSELTSQEKRNLRFFPRKSFLN